MKYESDPVTRLRSTFWMDTKDSDDGYHTDEDDVSYAKGYAELIDRKGALGFPTGDLTDTVARDLTIEMIGYVVALVDNVPDDTTIKIINLLGEAFTSMNLLRRDIALRVAHANWGDEGVRLTKLLSDDDANPTDRIEAATRIANLTIEAMRGDLDE